jgi:cytochrome c oxidase subunit 4
VTAVEVFVYYFDIQQAIFVGILLGLSAVKFSLVVMFFMHLKFDSRLFSTAFLTGFALAAAVFVVVLATLGGSLV